MTQSRLYLDYNATSPLSPLVRQWLESGDFIFANPSSQHTDGKHSRKVINQAKTFIYNFFQLTEKDFNLFFHSGATEGLNSIVYHFEHRAHQENRPLIVAYAQGDHPAVVEACKESGGIAFVLKRNSEGDYLHEENLEGILALKNAHPNAIILYNHLWVHNEIGVVSPLNELARFKMIPDLFISVDAVQSPGKHYHYRDLDSTFDFYTFSAHKFGSLKGIGFSFVSTHTMLKPFIVGGGQQNKLRPGTENVMGVHSIKLALQDLQTYDLTATLQYKGRIEEKLGFWLKGKGEIIGSKAQHRSLNTIYFYLNNLTSDIAVAMFDIAGLQISAGSACSSGASKDSEILLSLGYEKFAKNGLRLSLGFNFSESELETLLAKAADVFARIP